jgi:hypothetical protein
MVVLLEIYFSHIVNSDAESFAIICATDVIHTNCIINIIRLSSLNKSYQYPEAKEKTKDVASYTLSDCLAFLEVNNLDRFYQGRG